MVTNENNILKKREDKPKVNPYVHVIVILYWKETNMICKQYMIITWLGR